MNDETPTPTRAASPVPMITALEQRILLDAAGVVTGAEALDDDTRDDAAALAEAEALAPQTRERREVAFVDGGLEDVDTLIADLPDSAEVVVIDPAQDGVEAMAAYLDGQSGVDAVHVFGHGAAGQATLGTATLDAGTLDAHADALRGIGDALTEAGDILLYGCYVGAGPEGEAFVEDIAALTSADVAASDDLTGAAALGGDWDLEVSEGEIGVLAAFSGEYLHVLQGAERYTVGVIEFAEDDSGNTIKLKDLDASDAPGIAFIWEIDPEGTTTGVDNVSHLKRNASDIWLNRLSVAYIGYQQSSTNAFNFYTDNITAFGDDPGRQVMQVNFGAERSDNLTTIPSDPDDGVDIPTLKRWSEDTADDGMNGDKTEDVKVWAELVFEVTNRPPVAGTGETITINEGGSETLTAANTGSSDPDAGDTLSFSTDASASGVVSVGTDASLKGTKSKGTVSFTVTDSQGETDNGSVNLNVVYDDDPTTWGSPPSGVTWSGHDQQSYSWASGASDPDDSVSYSYESGKADWMSASGSNPITGNPGVSQHGDTETINVSAEGSTKVNRSFNIHISGSPETDVDGNSVTGGSLNDAPDVQTDGSEDIRLDEDSHHDFTAGLFEGFFSDADAGTLYNELHSLVLIEQPDHGKLLYDDGSGYALIEPGGNALSPSNPFRIEKADIANMRYEPDANFNGDDEFGFMLSDGLADSSAATMDIVVDPVNDAPVLDADGGADFTTITEDDVLASDETAANIGDTVSSLLDGQVTDIDTQPSSENPNGADNGKELGMAIFAETIVGPGDGFWEYWIDDGTSGYTDDANWNGLSEQGALSESSALLLGPNDRLRFNPDGERGNGGEPATSDYYDAADANADTSIAEQVPNPPEKSTISYYAWDGSGDFGRDDNDERRADVRDAERDSSAADGASTSPFSYTGDSTGIAVEDRNDAPSLLGMSVGGGDRFDLGFSGAQGTDEADAHYGVTDAEFVDQNADVLEGESVPPEDLATLTDKDKNDDPDNGLTEIDYAGYRVEIARKAPNTTTAAWDDVTDGNDGFQTRGDDGLTGSSVDQFGFDFTGSNSPEFDLLKIDGEDTKENVSVGDQITLDGAVVATVLSVSTDYNQNTDATDYFEIEFRNTGAGTGDETRATQAVVDAILQSITYRADKPYGDARFKMTVKDVPYPYSADGDSTMDTRETAVGEFEVRSKDIFVTQLGEAEPPNVPAIEGQAAAKTSTIDSADGITLREAVIIAEEQGGERVIHLHGEQTITEDLLIEATTDSGSADITLQLDGDATLNVADGKTLTIDADITGKGVLTKTGGGTLILNGDNDFGDGTPNITVENGTVAGHAGALGGTASHIIDVKSGASLLIVQGDDSNVQGGPSGVTDADAGTLSATLTGSGTIEKTGDDILTLTASGTTHDGLFIVNQGTVKTATSGALGAQSTVEIYGGHSLSSHGGTLDIAASQTIAELRSNHTAETNNARLEIADGEILTVDQATNSTFTGQVTGEGGLVKRGEGSLTLDNFGEDKAGDAPPNEDAGESDYTGDTVVEAGTLVATGHSIGDTSSVKVHGGATFQITGDEEIGSLASVETGSGEAIVEIDDGDGTEEPGTPTLTTGGNGEDTTFAGRIGGEGGLTKTGSGGMTLDTTGDTGDPGGNTFAGPLTVEEGDVTTKGGKSIGDGTPVEVNFPGTLNVDDSEEVGSLSGDGDVNIGGDTEIGQGLTARLEARLRPNVEDAVNVGDRIEYTLTLEETAGSPLDITVFKRQLSNGKNVVFKDSDLAGYDGAAAYDDDTGLAEAQIALNTNGQQTLTAVYTLTQADIDAGTDIGLTVELDPLNDTESDPAIVELTETTRLTPNTPADVLTIGGDDTSDPVGDGGSFGGTTSGPGGLNVTAPEGLTVEGPNAPSGDLGHDGGTVVGNGGGLTNKGTISGEGDITVEGGDDSTDPETPGGTFVNEGTITDGDGDPESDDGDGGDVNVLGPNGDFDNEPGGTVEGDVDNDGGTVTNGGTIGGDVENSGDGAGFTNEDGGTVEGDVDNEDGGTVDNDGTVKGDVTTDGGGVTNGGTVEGGVTVTGGGTFDNEEGGTVEGDAEVDDGTFNNDGTVKGDVTYIPPDGNVTGDGTIEGTVSPEEFVVDLHGTIDRGDNDKIDAGDSITYTMTVTNKTIEELDFATGGLDLSLATVHDPVADAQGAETGTFTLVSKADGDDLFDEGETWVYTATVTLDQAVFEGNGTDKTGVFDDDGDIDQSVRVDGTTEGKDFFGTDTAATALRDDLDVDLRQVGRVIDVDGDGFVTVADRIDYVTKVRNTGNLSIAPGDPGFEITGPASPSDLSRQSSFDDGTDDTLSAGEVWTYTHSYQLTESDLGNGPITGGASFAGAVVAGSDTVTETATSSVALKIADAPETRSVIDPKSDTSETARLTVGGLVMEPDGVNKFDIAGTDPEQTAANGGHDQIRVTGESASVRLNGAELRVNLIDGDGGSAPFIPARDESFVLIDNNADAAIEGRFTYAADNDRGRFTDGTDNDAPINTDGATRTTVEEGDILRFDGYDFRISYIGDTDGDGTSDEGPHDVTLTRVNMYPEVLADAEDRYNDGQGARLHSYPAAAEIDGTGLASGDRASGSKEAGYDADAAGLVTIDLGADAHATEIDLSARDTHSDFEVVAEAGEDNQGTRATDDIANLPFKVSGTLGLYDPDADDTFALAGEADGKALAAEDENGVTAVAVEHYAATADANGDADVLSGDPRQPDEATLRKLFSASIDGTDKEDIQGDFSGDTQQAATATLSWTFDASGEAAAAFDYLDENEVLDITYTLRVTDGQEVTWDIARGGADATDAYTEHAVTVRVIGTNDPVKVLVDETGQAPDVDHLWQFGRDYLDNDEGRELNVFTISTEGREEVTPLSDGDRIYDISRLFVDRDVTEDRDVTRPILARDAPDGLAARDGVQENLFFTITSTKPSTGDVLEGPTPAEMFEADGEGNPIWGQLKAEFAGGTMQGMLPGLTLDMDTGVISGRPIDVGTYVIDVTAIDTDGATATRSFELLIVAPPDGVVPAAPREAPPDPRPASDVLRPRIVRDGLPSGIFTGLGLSEDAATAAAVLQPEAPSEASLPERNGMFGVFVRANGAVVFETREADAEFVDAAPFEVATIGDDLVFDLSDRLVADAVAIEVLDMRTGHAMADVTVDGETGEVTLRGVSARDIERLSLVVRYGDGRALRMDVDLDLDAFEGRSAAATDAGGLRLAGAFRESARVEVAAMRAAAGQYEGLLSELR